MEISPPMDVSTNQPKNTTENILPINHLIVHIACFPSKNSYEISRASRMTTLPQHNTPDYLPINNHINNPIYNRQSIDN